MDVQADVECQALSIRGAAREAGVVYSTARNRILGLKSGTPGPPTKFSAEEEQNMDDFLLSSADLGVPLTRKLFEKVC